MKTEQFHDLNLKQAETIIEVAGQLAQLAEKLVCMIRGVLDNLSAKPEIARAN
jgi:hypothetical protein